MADANDSVRSIEWYAVNVGAFESPRGQRSDPGA